MASPTFVGAGTGTNINTSAAIPRPAVSAGDLMVLIVEQTNSAGSVTPPSGWTLIDEADPNNSFRSSYHAYSKIAGASEPSTYTVTLTTQIAGCAVILAWTGVDQTTPINASTHQQNETSQTAVPIPGVTTTVADTTLVTIYGETDAFSSGTFTPDAAMTQRAYEKIGTRAPFAIDDQAIAAIGATGTRTATASEAMRTGVISFAIAPAAAGGGATLTAAAGSFALSGQAAGLKAARKLAAGTGSFALSGQDAGLVGPGAKTLSAAAGIFAFTGQDVAFETAVPAGVASFTLSGQAAGLRVARRLAAGAGSFALAGQDVVLRAARALAAAQGSFALSGQAVTLTYSNAATRTPKSFLVPARTNTFRVPAE